MIVKHKREHIMSRERKITAEEQSMFETAMVRPIESHFGMNVKTFPTPVQRAQQKLAGFVY